MKKLWVTVILLVIVSAVLIVAATKKAVIREGVTFTNGVLDLRNTDVSTGSFLLAGKWEFYWRQLLRPNEFPVYAPSYISVPTLWNDIDLNGRPLSSSGYATYKLTIILPAQHPEMGLEVPDVYASFKLFVNDSLVARNGEPGIKPSASQPYWNTEYVRLPANKDTLVLLMQVANFWHAKGGTYNAPVLSNYAELKSTADFNKALDILVTGCFIMSGLFSFGLYLFSRTNRSILYFSLFCLAYSYRVIGGAPYVLHSLLPGMSWFVTIRLEYLSLTLYVAFFVAYLRSLYPKESSYTLVLMLFWICIAYSVVILFTPVILFTSILPVFLVSLFFYIGYAFVVFTKALLHQRQGAEYAFLSSGVVLILFFVINIAYFGFTTPLKEVILVGYVVFLFLQSLILSSRFAYVLKTSAVKAELGLKAKAEFLSTISHEIRTPLNALIGMSHLLLHNKPRSDQKENLKAIVFSANNLLNMVNNILQYNALENVELNTSVGEREISLRDMVMKVLKAEEDTATAKGIALQTTIGEDVPGIVKADVEKLEQVLSCLLNNAVKFTHEGTVTMTVQLQKIEDNKATVLFAIEDTGIGIEPQLEAIIFDEFTQGDASLSREYGGTGLGLAICKRILQSQGAVIHLKSQPGVGSVFSFELIFEVVPVSSGITPTQFEKSVLQSKPLLKQHILLAEDNSLNVLVAKSILEDFGASVEVAINGQQAVELFDASNFSLVLMDISMPVMDGFEAAKIIRSKNKIVPIIALTANTPEDVAQLQAVSLFDDVVEKPFNPDVLCRTLLRHLGIIL